MMLALVAVGVLATPVILALLSWMHAFMAERRALKSLLDEVQLLPSDPEDFSPEQAARASEILRDAWDLPAVVPTEVPELRILIHSVAEIESRAGEQSRRSSAKIVRPDAREAAAGAFAAAYRLILDDVVWPGHHGIEEPTPRRGGESSCLLGLWANDMLALQKAELTPEAEVKREVERALSGIEAEERKSI